jgi:lysophospholipase L1-like esterase
MKKLILFAVIFCLITSFKKKEISWVAIGDSVTYLNDHTNETQNRITKGYMTMVVEKLPNIHFINQEHNGWTTGNIADAIEKIKLVRADVYSIFLGTNDWWHDRPVGTFSDYQNSTGSKTAYGAYRIIIDKIHGLNADAKIIMITPLQRGDFVYIGNAKNNAYGSYKQDKSGQTLEQFADAVDSIADYEHCKLVDLYHKSGITQKNMVNFKHLKDSTSGTYKNYSYPDFVNISFNPEADEYPYPIEAMNMTYDGLHPSDKGHAVIAKMLVKIMKKY